MKSLQESLFDKDLATKEPPKVELKDIEDRDTALAYIEQNFKIKPEKSWEPKGRAIRIVYNPRLSLRIDFVNKYEFLYTIYGPNDEVIFDCNSTREAYSMHWDEFLDIKKYADNLKHTRANFGRNKSGIERLHRMADKIYELL